VIDPSVRELARHLIRHLELPAPVTEVDDPRAWPGGLLVIAGDDALVAITIEADVVMVGPGRFSWHGPAMPLQEVRSPERFDIRGGLTDDLIEQMQHAVHRSITRRRRGFRRCRYCDELFPSEHRNVEPTVCDGCAQRHLGVVF